MRSNFRTPVPSTTLLNFLKSQSEALCFFTPNPRAIAFDHAALCGLQLSGRHAPLVTAVRPLSTAVPRSVTIEAGFLNLDFLLPRVITIRQRNPQGAKYGSLRLDTQFRSQHNASTLAGRWRWRLWGRKKAIPRPLKPDDLPLKPFLDEGVDPSIFNLGRMSAKAMNEPKLRCTEFDENGNVVLVNGEFKKTELIAKVCRCLENRNTL
jgi:magnesium transporter